MVRRLHERVAVPVGADRRRGYLPPLCRDVAERDVAGLMYETFGERLDGSLERVVSRVSAAARISAAVRTEFHLTYGGFVMPCLEPVSTIMAGFS